MRYRVLEGYKLSGGDQLSEFQTERLPNSAPEMQTHDWLPDIPSQYQPRRCNLPRTPKSLEARHGPEIHLLRTADHPPRSKSYGSAQHGGQRSLEAQRERVPQKRDDVLDGETSGWR